MSTLSVDTPPKTTTLPQQNSIQTEKVNSVGNTQATQAVTEKAALPVQEIEKITQHLNDLMKDLKVGLNFEINKNDGQIIIKVVDTETKQVIRQIPSEESLHLRKTLDSTQGVILRTEA